jgi:hypothetical protein
MKHIQEIKNFIKQFIDIPTPTVSFELRDEQVQYIVDSTFAKFKSQLPDSMCFMCKNTMHGYKIGWRDHLFCSESCHREYARVIDKPDQDYKILEGDKVLEKINS